MIICAPAAFSQQVARTDVDAGQIEKRIEDRKQELRDRQEPAPDVAKPQKPVPSERDEKPFVLSAVNIIGATVFPVGVFAPLYEEFLGREISAGEIEIVLDRITRKYVDAGYFLSSAAAAPQDLEYGILTIDITEGRIDRVVYTGDKPGRPGLFQSWATKISGGRPAELSVVERYILLMNDLSGITATPSLAEREDESGVFDMTIAIKHTPVDAYSSLDNRGTHPVGPLQWAISGGLNSVLGALERTRISAFTVPDEPSELLYGEIYEQIPLGSEGTHAFASASRSLVDIYSESRGSQLQSAGTRYSIGAWHPLVRQQEIALYLNGRFDYSDSSQSATNDNYLDRLRVARLGARLWFKDQIGGSTSTTVTYSRGLDLLGASPVGYNVSRTDGASRFSKFHIDLNRVQRITDDLWLQLSAAGQHSKDILLSGEEFAVGGSRFGRGYDPSEISDSRGVAGSLEVRQRLPIDEGPFSALWLYGFFDGGVVWRTGNTKDSLSSAGVGLRFFPMDGLRASLEYAKPLTRIVSEEGNRSGRVFFSLQIEF